MEAIAYIHTDFKEKFGIPRQSGLVNSKGYITFVPKYNNPDAVRGLEQFSHIWLIWDFSRAHKEEWSPTVRPPRLGGNKRVGVFATRSPFRPNSLGLSCVRLTKVETGGPRGVVLHVEGADILDGTPIFDIKPYLTYADCKPDALCGFASDAPREMREVIFECEIPSLMDSDTAGAVAGILKQDPRPSYQEDEEKIYGMRYGDFEIRFKAEQSRIRVVEIDITK